MIKHIFLDMDNTLLNSAGELSKGNISMIKHCGIPVTLVTARPPAAMRTTISQLALVDEQVAFNGGLIFKMTGSTYETLFSKGIAFKTVTQILATVQKAFPETSASWFTLQDWFTEKKSQAIIREANITHQKPVMMPFNELTQLTKTTIYKIMLISPTPADTEILEKYLQTLHFPGITVTRSNRNYLEITNEEISKRNGILYLKKRNGLVKHELAAFGDGRNDMTMFDVVGTAIAMANAEPTVKKAADYVTRSNDADGVGYGIQKILAKNPH